MDDKILTMFDKKIVDRVLNDILIDFPIIEEEKSWNDEAWNLMAMRVAKRVNMLKEKYEQEYKDSDSDFIYDQSTKYREKQIEPVIIEGHLE